MKIKLTSSNRGIGWRKFSREGLGWRISRFVVALVAIGVALGIGEYFVATPASEASTGAAAPAVFTGEFVEGVPVYRLPPINVVAHRGAAASN